MTFMKYNLDQMVDSNHPLRKIEEIISFKSLTYRVKDLETKTGRKGYGLSRQESLVKKGKGGKERTLWEEPTQESLASTWKRVLRGNG